MAAHDSGRVAETAPDGDPEDEQEAAEQLSLTLPPRRSSHSGSTDQHSLSPTVPSKTAVRKSAAHPVTCDGPAPLPQIPERSRALAIADEHAENDAAAVLLHYASLLVNETTNTSSVESSTDNNSRAIIKARG